MRATRTDGRRSTGRRRSARLLLPWEALLEAGADPNARDKRVRTPLHYAAAKDEILLEVVEALLDAGADTAAKDSEGKTTIEGVKPGSPFRGTDAYRRLGGRGEVL